MWVCGRASCCRQEQINMEGWGDWRWVASIKRVERPGERWREITCTRRHMRMHTNKPASLLCMQPCVLGHVASSPWQSLKKQAGACVCAFFFYMHFAKKIYFAKKQQKKITIQVSVSAEQHEPKTSDLITFLIPPILQPPILLFTALL